MEDSATTAKLSDMTLHLEGEPQGLAGLSAADFEWQDKLVRKSRKRYEFIRTVGIGGMKTVLLTYDRDTDREVALAFMPDYSERDADDIGNFVREAFITASLEHPHIVPVYDVGKDCNGVPYFVMKYLRGESLSTILRRLGSGDPEALDKYSLNTLLLAFRKVCYAVEFAHSKGVLHLDIKPSNINLGEIGEVQLLDWGLARIMDGTRHLPRSARLAARRGTPGYMAPEQVDDRFDLISDYTDVYSLGAVLFAILTFHGPGSRFKHDISAMVRATADGSIVAEADFTNEFRAMPSVLEQICRKAMAREPMHRYVTVHELREDIDNYMENYPIKAVQVPLWARCLLFVRRNILSVLAVLLAAVLGGAAYLLFTGRISF